MIRWNGNIVCPSCGETEGYKAVPDGNNHGLPYFRGIMYVTSKTYYKRIFRKKIMRVDHYHCYTCDTPFKTKPYILWEPQKTRKETSL
jgi:hypothetical protein